MGEIQRSFSGTAEFGRAEPESGGGGDGNVTGFGELVGQAADPIGKAEDFVNVRRVFKKFETGVAA